MKIKISYDPEDQEERYASYSIAQFAQMVMDRLAGKVRVKESDTHPPLCHVYISTRAPDQDDG